MITEYVYENQEYENVLVKIKAALMDIISSEENKLYEIEQKITTTTDEIFKEKLSKLCADERCALRQIIITMNTLSASLEKVDSYSKDLDSIEDENIKEIIADLKNENVNNISESLDSPVYKQGETIESINQDPDVVREINDYADSKEEPVVEESVEQVPEEITTQEEPTEVQEEDIESSQEEPIMVQEQEEIAEPVEQTEEKETPVVEENDEETYPTEEQEETIEQATPTIEEKTEPTEQSEEISNEVEDTPISEQIEPEETITSSEEVVPEVSQEVQNEEQVYENQPIETTIDNTEVVQEEQPENAPLIPIVTEQTKQQQPRKEKEEQPSSENVEEDVVAPPSVDENGLEQEFSPSIPAIENQENVTYQEDLPKEPLMTFIKVSKDSPKAILTSLKQVTNLRSSYKTQNALLSSRGTIASRNINGVDSEVQELVDNGLLAPSSENIEAMMNEANKLYQEGKINEAQEMYDQISILNKQLKESSSVVK
ncbi:MAG: hypothetical protein SPJ74_04505 [Bacilli bacterium]|nr:hypothetical protein [Bacilli bacterium]